MDITAGGWLPAVLMGIKMAKFNAIAAALAAQHNACSFKVNVKSDSVAIITLEFVTEWASNFSVRGAVVTQID